MSFGPYSKAIVAIVGAVIVGLTSYFGADVPAWFNTLVAILTAAGVYQVSNEER